MKKHSFDVGALKVESRRRGAFTITEPLTDCCVAKGFPTEMHAAAAAKEMNKVADWAGIIKTRGQGRRPNCQDELERIVESFGGKLAYGATAATRAICADVAAQLDLRVGPAP
jgi:hypothetical protein